MDTVFGELGAKRKPYLTTDQFTKMLNNRQRDPRLNEILHPYYIKEQAQALITQHEKNNKTFADQGNISVEGLTNYLMSPDNHVLFQSKLNIHQEMTFPISHYFINSSHNTYLTGHQLNGESSVEIYRQILLSGCRCIELDCWDGRTEEEEPIITHGFTLCTKILFRDVIEAIKETAFKTTDYPLILSFENHCTAKQQLKMATYCVQIFGDLLLDKPLDEYPCEPEKDGVGFPLPSPKALKGKILIKNKKRVIKVAKSSASGADSLPSASLSQDSPLEGVAEVPEESVETEDAGDDEEETKPPIVKTEVREVKKKNVTCVRYRGVMRP
jgi:phosphatidylinositol phospholipase C beta